MSSVYSAFIELVHRHVHINVLCAHDHTKKDTSSLATNGEVGINKLVAKDNANTRGWTLLEYGVVRLSR